MRDTILDEVLKLLMQTRIKIEQGGNAKDLLSDLNIDICKLADKEQKICPIFNKNIKVFIPRGRGKTFCRESYNNGYKQAKEDNDLAIKIYEKIKNRITISKCAFCIFDSGDKECELRFSKIEECIKFFKGE